MLWSHNLQSTKHSIAVNNLKAKLTALQTTNATKATALAIAIATESLNEKITQDVYRELRLLNLEKNLKKTEQKTNEINKKIKNNSKRNQQKNSKGTHFTESMDTPNRKTLTSNKNQSMVDLTNDNNKDSPLDSLHPQNLIKQSQGKRKQQTLYSPPTKKSSIQWKTSQIKQFDPAFPAATTMPTMPTQTFVATHSGALAPPLFFQRAPPPTPLTVLSLNPFTAIETRGYNTLSLHGQEQQLQGQRANPTPPNPHNPFYSAPQLQYQGLGRNQNKHTRHSGKRTYNQKQNRNRLRRSQDK
jgi:hypothetical protein